MPRRRVADNLVEHVAAARMVPQVVMRIDDRQLRFERRLSDLREPRVAFLFGLRHGSLPAVVTVTLLRYPK